MASTTRRAASSATEILAVARAHYLEELSKVEIADRFGLSRFQVARMLEIAKQRGYVRIQVGDPDPVDDELGEELAEALGVSRAIVVGSSPASGATSTKDAVAAALASTLAELVRPGMSVGFAWSWVLELLPRHLTRLEPCDVVQLTGEISNSGNRLDLVKVIHRVAVSAEGSAFPMYAPLIADSAESAEIFSRQPDIADCLRRAAGVDLAVFPIGAWDPEGSLLCSMLPTEEVARVGRSGGCGEVAGHAFDASGRPPAENVSDRIIGITAEQLRRVPTRIGTSYGPHRAKATIGAAAAGLLSTVIVDDALARTALQQLD